MESVLDDLNMLNTRMEYVKGRIKLPKKVIDALNYIDEHTEASKSNVIEEALNKFNIVKKADALKKELNSN